MKEEQVKVGFRLHRITLNVIHTEKAIMPSSYTHFCLSTTTINFFFFLMFQGSIQIWTKNLLYIYSTMSPKRHSFYHCATEVICQTLFVQTNTEKALTHNRSHLTSPPFISLIDTIKMQKHTDTVQYTITNIFQIHNIKFISQLLCNLV